MHFRLHKGNFSLYTLHQQQKLVIFKQETVDQQQGEQAKSEFMVKVRHRTVHVRTQY